MIKVHASQGQWRVWQARPEKEAQGETMKGSHLFCMDYITSTAASSIAVPGKSQCQWLPPLNMLMKPPHLSHAFLQLSLLPSLLVAAVSVTLEQTEDSCCGYIITNRNNAYFSYEYVVDFSKLDGLEALTGWNVSDGVRAGGQNLFTLQVPMASAGNVAIVKGEGLALKVPAQDEHAKELKVAEVVFAEPIFGGLFFSKIKLSDTFGTCAGIFTSAANRSLGWNDEQDIEMLSGSLLMPSDTQPAGFHMINWEPDTGAKANSISPFPPNVHPSERYNSWEIGWFPENSTSNTPANTQIRFNKEPVTNSPRKFPSTHPSVFIFNLWTNADSAWSGGPPSKDAVMYVKNFAAYYDKPDGIFEGSGVAKRTCDRAQACKRKIGCERS
ncbi:hypothetical protein QFC22_006381 [Naganishia vaughanmartiniae]|uniref:Uncharacterized protein n=1 Tax=Naganishia vaughanmartiniae TaxID=1424756 RepID=A0ACC2WNG2_9TREE|nr:hypothetical protein QFC22_006381 [Naganishia vaughanmartiniae]